MRQGVVLNTDECLRKGILNCGATCINENGLTTETQDTWRKDTHSCLGTMPGVVPMMEQDSKKNVPPCVCKAIPDR